MVVCGIAILALAFAMTAAAQEVSLEYRVKAAYLFNFTKFVDWPPEALPEGAPLTICVAGRNPFGDALEETVRGELVGGRPLAIRAVGDPAGCHVLFVPGGVNPDGVLRAVRGKPVLTVGETDDFLAAGGIINFVMRDGKVRFEISHDAALHARLRISSRLLRLARPPETR